MATKIKGVAVKWSQNGKGKVVNPGFNVADTRNNMYYEDVYLYNSKCWTNMSFDANRVCKHERAYHFHNWPIEGVAVIGEVSVTMGEFTHYFINDKYRTNGPGIVYKNGSQEWFDENGVKTKMIDQFGRNLLTLDLDALLEEWKRKKKAGFNGN